MINKFDHKVLYKGKWVRCEDCALAEKDIEEFTFCIYDNGKRVPVKAKVYAYEMRYTKDWPKPLQWLTTRYEKWIWIDFSTDIGPERGTWKGGIVSDYYPFTKNIKTSWTNYEYLELPKIKGAKCTK